MRRQDLGKGHLPDNFSDPAPHLTDLEKHRQRVRNLLDENWDGTRNWHRVHMSSKEKGSEDQESWSRYGDRVMSGNYHGAQNIPASDSHEEAQQQRPNSPTAQARRVSQQQRAGVPTLAGVHVEATDLGEAQHTVNVPKVEKGTKLIRTPGVLTVEQAEKFARLTSVGLRPEFVAPPAPDRGFRFAGYYYTSEGDIIQPFPTKRSMERDSMMSVGGLVHPRAAKPHEKVGTAAESASTSQSGGVETGDTRERGRIARGGAITRGKGGMVRGGDSTRGRATTRGGGKARGCHTALTQQVPSGQIQRSSNPQDSSTLPAHGSSVLRGDISHHVYLQTGEMERRPIEQVQQPLGPMNGHVYSDGIAQGRPSGFLPMTRSAPPPYAIPGDQVRGQQRSRPNSVQRQEDITISSRGPIPGTSYTFPSLEQGLRIAEDGVHQQALPVQAQQSPLTLNISNSRMPLPPPLFPYGQGRHGEYNMQTSMPPSAERDAWHQLPTPPQQFAMPRATPQWAQSGPQQPLPSASQRPAMPPPAARGPQQQLPTPPLQPQILPSPATAPAPWPLVQFQYNGGRAGVQSGGAGQTAGPPVVEEGGSRVWIPAQYPQRAVRDFGLVGQNRPT